MRLSAIKLAGFKSFADQTTLVLPTNLTAVVGPNGNGKSNLIDAVRWVLGESSAKALRGSESEDVIFNGARDRKPGGRAAVELLFDNADRQLQGAWGRYTEISVRRELVRGAGSQYAINGQRCLKRDVVDLFLGTGLGGRNQYAILEQGTVAQLVEAKPDELRQWLEEAAGISRYKERRRETESRILQTRDNLARLADLQQEVADRAEVLTRQAAEAEAYRQAVGEQERVRGELLWLRRRVLHDELEQRSAGVGTRRGELEAARQARTRCVEERAAAERDRDAANAAFNAAQAVVYEAQAALASASQELVRARDLRAARERELVALREQLEHLQGLTAQHAADGSARERELDALRSELDAGQRRHAEAAQALAVAGQALTAALDAWEAADERLRAPLLEAERERVRVQALGKAAEALEGRQRRLARERDSLSLATLETEQERLGAVAATLEREAQDALNASAACEERLAALRQQLAALEPQLREQRPELERLHGRISSLETLQRAARHADDRELEEWLRARGWQDCPRLVDVVRVEAGWETAVEQVLADWLQAPVARAGESAAFPASGPAGGVSVVRQGEAISNGTSGTLGERVKVPRALGERLQRVRAVEDGGADAVGTLEAGWSVIDRAGVWRGRGWIRYPRRDTEDKGTIARASALRDARDRLDAVGRRVAELEAAVQDVRERTGRSEAERRSADARRDALRTRHAQANADWRAQAVRVEQARRRSAELDAELETVRVEREETAQALRAAQEGLRALEQQLQHVKTERDQLGQALTSARQAEAETRRDEAGAARDLNALSVREAGLRSATEMARRSAAEMQDQAVVLRRRLVDAQARLAQADAPIREGQIAAKGCESVVQDATEGLRQRRDALAAAGGRMEAAQPALQAADVRCDALSSTVQAAEVELAAARSRWEALDAQLREAGLEAEAVEARIPRAATIEAWERKLAQLARRIEKFGAVNLAAIPELEQTRGRVTYLAAQRSDLEQALATLEEAMRKLDHETRDLFRSTFDRVNLRFRE
ncbi:MAG TPA: chromosome segregation protein SMC, partial [Nevskiaceae bacterium]